MRIHGLTESNTVDQKALMVCLCLMVVSGLLAGIGCRSIMIGLATFIGEFAVTLAVGLIVRGPRD